MTSHKEYPMTGTTLSTTRTTRAARRLLAAATLTVATGLIGGVLQSPATAYAAPNGSHAHGASLLQGNSSARVRGFIHFYRPNLQVGGWNARTPSPLSPGV
jgi:hypothetical protein